MQKHRRYSDRKLRQLLLFLPLPIISLCPHRDAKTYSRRAKTGPLHPIAKSVTLRVRSATVPNFLMVLHSSILWWCTTKTSTGFNGMSRLNQTPINFATGHWQNLDRVRFSNSILNGYTYASHKCASNINCPETYDANRFLSSTGPWRNRFYQRQHSAIFQDNSIRLRRGNLHLQPQISRAKWWHCSFVLYPLASFDDEMFAGNLHPAWQVCNFFRRAKTGPCLRLHLLPIFYFKWRSNLVMMHDVDDGFDGMATLCETSKSDLHTACPAMFAAPSLNCVEQAQQ